VFKTVYETVRRDGSYRGEILGQRFDGQAVPIDASVFSISAATGAIEYVVGIGRDVTERKKNEEALRRAHDELEQRVLERTAELAHVNEALLAEVSERKQAEDALRRSHQQLAKQNAVLADLAKRSSPEHGDLAASLGELTEAAAGTLDVRRVGVWLYRDERHAIEALDTYDANSRQHERGQMLFAADFPSDFEALRLQRTIAAHDAHVDPRTREFSASYLTPNGITSMLDAPIWLEGRMVGVVCLEHVGPVRRWTPEEERFAASVADFASLTIEADQRRRAEAALRRAHDELERRVDERTAQLAKMNVAYRDESARDSLRLRRRARALFAGSFDG
jgi:C4-dicarboxylate-specific signal transduction histidine kinase